MKTLVSFLLLLLVAPSSFGASKYLCTSQCGHLSGIDEATQGAFLQTVTAAGPDRATAFANLKAKCPSEIKGVATELYQGFFIQVQHRGPANLIGKGFEATAENACTEL